MQVRGLALLEGYSDNIVCKKFGSSKPVPHETHHWPGEAFVHQLLSTLASCCTLQVRQHRTAARQ